MGEIVHDEFCFCTDLYDPYAEAHMCICARLSSAREQTKQDIVNAPAVVGLLSPADVPARQRDLVERWRLRCEEENSRGFTFGLSKGQKAGINAALDVIESIFEELPVEGAPDAEGTPLTGEEIVREARRRLKGQVFA